MARKKASRSTAPARKPTIDELTQALNNERQQRLQQENVNTQLFNTLAGKIQALEQRALNTETLLARAASPPGSGQTSAG